MLLNCYSDNKHENCKSVTVTKCDKLPVKATQKPVYFIKLLKTRKHKLSAMCKYRLIRLLKLNINITAQS